MKKLIIPLLLLCSYNSYAQEQDTSKKIRAGVIVRCSENNDALKCQCFADELFKNYTADELIELNQREASEEKKNAFIEWVASKPCGADFILKD